MKKYIKLRLTRKQADALMNAGNRGVEDLNDAGFNERISSESNRHSRLATDVLNELGRLMAEAWPEEIKQ